MNLLSRENAQHTPATAIFTGFPRIRRVPPPAGITATANFPCTAPIAVTTFEPSGLQTPATPPLTSVRGAPQRPLLSRLTTAVSLFGVRAFFTNAMDRPSGDQLAILE